MDDKELWVRFACTALSSLISDGQYVNNVKNDCEMAAQYADEMLENFHYTFDGDGDGK